MLPPVSTFETPTKFYPIVEQHVPASCDVSPKPRCAYRDGHPADSTIMTATPHAVPSLAFLYIFFDTSKGVTSVHGLLHAPLLFCSPVYHFFPPTLRLPPFSPRQDARLRHSALEMARRRVTVRVPVPPCAMQYAHIFSQLFCYQRLCFCLLWGWCDPSDTS